LQAALKLRTRRGSGTKKEDSKGNAKSDREKIVKQEAKRITVGCKASGKTSRCLDLPYVLEQIRPKMKIFKTKKKTKERGPSAKKNNTKKKKRGRLSRKRVCRPCGLLLGRPGRGKGKNGPRDGSMGRGSERWEGKNSPEKRNRRNCTRMGSNASWAKRRGRSGNEKRVP